MGRAPHAHEQKVATLARQHHGAVVGAGFLDVVEATVLDHAEPGVLIDGFHLISKPMAVRIFRYRPNQLRRVK
jgi:hypothetical protein